MIVAIRAIQATHSRIRWYIKSNVLRMSSSDVYAILALESFDIRLTEYFDVQKPWL